MRFFQTTHLLMCMSFGTLMCIIRIWLTFSGKTDRPGKLCYIFLISKDLTQIINFPFWIRDCNSHSPALMDLFLSPDASICSAMSQFPLTFR